MTVQEVITNDAYGTLAAGAAAVAQGTVQSWTMTSSNLPSCASGVTQFRLVDQQAQSEIILVTVSNGTALTVTRGAENSTPVAHAPAAVFALTITAGVLENLTNALPTLSEVSISVSATLTLNEITEVTAGSALTMTLPSSVANSLIVVERASASTANVTISGNIRGVPSSTVTLQLASESETFFGDGTTWWPIAGHKTLASLQALFSTLTTSTPLAGQMASATGSGNGSKWGNFAGLAPSGDTTGVTDTAAIQGLLNLAGYAALQNGTFYTNAPVQCAAGAVLRGAEGSTSSVYDAAPPSHGTIIKPASGFAASGSGAWAVVTIMGAGVRLRDFFIDCSNLTSGNGTIHGICDNTGFSAAYLENIGIYNIPGASAYGIYQQGSAWHLYTIVVCTTQNDGFHGYWTDSVLVNCHAQCCGLNGSGSGFWIAGGDAHLISCRGDLSQWGFSIDVIGGNVYQDPVILSGCSTQRNNKSGYRIRNDNSTYGAAPIVISGCFSDGDGVNGTLQASGQGSYVTSSGLGGGGYAAIDVWGQGVVTVSGFVNTCATRESAVACPQYGLATHTDWNTSTEVPDFITVAGSFLAGNTAIYNDGAPANLLRFSDSGGYAGGIFLGVANSESPDLIATPTQNPAQLGIGGWNYPSLQAETSSPNLTSGVGYLLRVPMAESSKPLTNLLLGVASQGSGLTSGECFAAAFDQNGNLIGSSADQSGSWTTTGLKTIALSGGPYTGTWPFIYVLIISNGTTNPAFARASGSGVGSSLFNLNATGSAIPFATNGTSRTSVPSTLTYSSNSATANNPQSIWVGWS